MKFNSEEYALLKMVMQHVMEQCHTDAIPADKLRIWNELVQKLDLQQAVIGTYLHELNMQVRMYLYKNILPHEEKNSLELLCKKMKRTSHSFR